MINPNCLKISATENTVPGFKPAGLEKSRPLVESVKKLALKYNVTPAQIALNWLVNFHGNTVVAIPGATKEIHVKENVGAMSFRLSDEDMARLDRESAIFK